MQCKVYRVQWVLLELAPRILSIEYTLYTRRGTVEYLQGSWYWERCINHLFTSKLM